MTTPLSHTNDANVAQLQRAINALRALYTEALAVLSQRKATAITKFVEAHEQLLAYREREVGQLAEALIAAQEANRDLLAQLAQRAKDPATLPARMMQAMEDFLIKMIQKGEWVTVDYNSKVKLGTEAFRGIYEGLDLQRIRTRVRERAEQEVADRLLASLATELSTDVKQIMSNRELRERARATLRGHIEAVAAGTAPTLEDGRKIMLELLDHEGAEGFSEGLRERAEQFLAHTAGR